MDEQRIDPLTISDAASRYLLRCQAVEKTDTARVRAIFEATFREYGLPLAMRTDNGPPFASRAIAGLSPSALYLMKLNIVPERIAPGHPEQNGRHERMHRTMKAENRQTAGGSCSGAAKVHLTISQRIYNEQRPHQALHMKTFELLLCALFNEPTHRVCRNPENDSDMQVRKVGPCETFWLEKGKRSLSAKP